jgi:carbon storage regulator
MENGYQEGDMLVLRRRSGESIQIDSNIRVVVLSVSNGQAKLGFEAPDHIRILRAELQDCEAHNVGSDRNARP